MIKGHHAVTSVGTTPFAVFVQARTHAHGLHARSKTENGSAATDVLDAVFAILVSCLDDAMYCAGVRIDIIKKLLPKIRDSRRPHEWIC